MLNVTFVSVYLRLNEYDNKYSLGSSRLASYIQDLDDVNINVLTLNEKSTLEEVDEFTDFLNKEDMNILCLSAYIWTWELISRISERFRIAQDRCIVVGGPELKNRDLKQLSSKSFCVLGEGEEFIRSICIHMLEGKKIDDIRAMNEISLASKQDNVYHMQESDTILTKNPLFSDAFFEKVKMKDFNKKFLWYETSRGCVCQCGYCGFRQRTKMSTIDINFVEQEIKNIGKINPERIFVVDAIIGGTPENGKKVLQLFQRYASNTILYAYLRAEFLDEEYMDILANSNIGEVRIGIQTMNHVIPNWLRNNNIRAIKELLPRLAKTNIPWRAELIVGLPGDDLEGLKESIKFVINELHPTRVYAYHLTILKETQLYSYMLTEAHNWIRIEDDCQCVKACYSYTNQELKTMVKYGVLITSLYNSYVYHENGIDKNCAPDFATLDEKVRFVQAQINENKYMQYAEGQQFWQEHID